MSPAWSAGCSLHGELGQSAAKSRVSSAFSCAGVAGAVISSSRSPCNAPNVFTSYDELLAVLRNAASANPGTSTVSRPVLAAKASRTFANAAESTPVRIRSVAPTTPVAARYRHTTSAGEPKPDGSCNVSPSAGPTTDAPTFSQPDPGLDRPLEVGTAVDTEPGEEVDGAPDWPGGADAVAIPAVGEAAAAAPVEYRGPATTGPADGEDGPLHAVRHTATTSPAAEAHTLVCSTGKP